MEISFRSLQGRNFHEIWGKKTPKISSKAAKLGSKFPVTGGVKTEGSWQFVEDDGEEVSISGWPWKSLLTQCQGTAESMVPELWEERVLHPHPCGEKLGTAGPVLVLLGWKAIPLPARTSCVPSTVELEEAQGIWDLALPVTPEVLWPLLSKTGKSSGWGCECTRWASFPGSQSHSRSHPSWWKVH